MLPEFGMTAPAFGYDTEMTGKKNQDMNFYITT